MNRLHARYPFMAAARSAVEAADVDLGEVVAEGGAPVERGRERVERALLEGTVVSETPRRWSDRAELLSYPVARVLVSLVDAPGAVEKYAEAEAAAAYDRLREDLQESADLRSASAQLSLSEFLAGFDLADDVTPVGDGRDDPEEYRLTVAAYLPLATGLDGERWRLVTRELDDGEVPVSREELNRLLRVAIRRRVAEGLPLSVPEGIATALDAEVEALRDALAEIDLARDIDTVVPGLFPPCMSALLDRARNADESLPPHSEFALVAFLASIGLDDEGMMALCGINDPASAEQLRYRVERLRERDGAQYAPPSCATMEAYGDCVNKDDLCAEISHPLEYYEERLDTADAPVDFRDV